MPRIDFRELLDFYRRELHDNFMAYWLKQVDWERGGVLNCLSNRGDKLLHEHKFVWSQGRFAWQCARLYETSVGEVPEETRKKYMDAARGTARFLMDHARIAGGGCAFVLSRDGRPIMIGDDGRERPIRPGEYYDYSTNADDFAYYGVSEYARVSGDREAYEWAKDVYQSLRQRIKAGTAHHDYPYPTPKGYKTHGTPMGLLEEAQELCRTAERFGDAPFAAELADTARQCMEDVMDLFVQPDKIVLEMLSPEYQPVDTLLGRYVNPGHTLEDMWFVIHQAMRLNDREVIDRAAEVTMATCRLGWDDEHGGIPQFCDRDGGQPKGPVPPELEREVMVHKVRNLWDKKLWWPHSEALYALLLVHEQTGSSEALDEYSRFHDYTFRTFPNPDKAVGEWIQIRNRRGEPEEAVVALPVKDPMHIVRAFIHTIQCLKRLTAKG
ncbi:MAG TPA: AGE family epimerase/isomerase [Planctomycetota bacterium]|nr:AGE family epimerase/isomerase [Planctomycetota bacterium]